MDDMKKYQNTAKGQSWATSVCRHRMEDPRLNPYDYKIATWIKSHTEDWSDKHLTRNEIARKLHISGGQVSKSLANLQNLNIIEITQNSGEQRFRIIFDLSTWEHDIYSAQELTGHNTTGEILTGHNTTGTGHNTTGNRSQYDRNSNKESNKEDISLLQKTVDNFWETFWAVWQKSPHPFSKLNRDVLFLFTGACKKADPVKIISVAESYIKGYQDALKAGLNPTYIVGAKNFLDQELYNEKLPTYAAPPAVAKNGSYFKPPETRPNIRPAQEIFAEQRAAQEEDEKLTNMQNKKLDEICPMWRKEYEGIKSKKLGGMNAAIYRKQLLAEHAIEAKI